MHTTKVLLIIFSITVQSLFLLLFLNETSKSKIQANCYKNEELSKNITISVNKISLLNAEDVFSVRNKSRRLFFFIESSLSGNVTARQLCAVESTARLHPYDDIVLLVVLPPTITQIEENESLRQVLRHQDNIQVLVINLEQYFTDSPLEDWYKSKIFEQSKFPIHHLSDILRIYTLWNYGGTYIDLDFIIIKPINITNFVVKSTEFNLISNGILSFVPTSPFIYYCMEDLKSNFDPEHFIANGPQVITRNMKKYCGLSKVEDMTKEMCGGISVLSAELFYPVPYTTCKYYFKGNTTEEDVMVKFKDCIGAHVWNKWSSKYKIFINSNQPYGLLAQRYCPRSYWSSLNVF